MVPSSVVQLPPLRAHTFAPGFTSKFSKDRFWTVDCFVVVIIPPLRVSMQMGTSLPHWFLSVTEKFPSGCPPPSTQLGLSGDPHRGGGHVSVHSP